MLYFDPMLDSRIMDASILAVSRYSRIQFYEISWQYIRDVIYEINSLSSRLDCSIIILLVILTPLDPASYCQVLRW